MPSPSDVVEQALRTVERGLAARARGDMDTAHAELVSAARLLTESARMAPPGVREHRLRQAEAVLARARELLPVTEHTPDAGGGGKPRPQADAGHRKGAPSWTVAERPPTRFSDVVGMEQVKEQIRIRMVYPYSHPELARQYGIQPGGGVLLFGPPGTGKTLLARAVAGELEAAFFLVRPSDVLSKWVGEAEQNLRLLFQGARSYARSVIFMDELESLVPRRSGTNSSVMPRVVAQLLQEMDGFSGSGPGGALLFLGATNEPWSLDEAVMRPGRLDMKAYVGLPDLEERARLLIMNLDGRLASLSDGDAQRLAEETEGYSGADLKRVCQHAADLAFLAAIRGEGAERPVDADALRRALRDVHPTVSRRTLERFQAFAEEGARRSGAKS